MTFNITVDLSEVKGMLDGVEDVVESMSSARFKTTAIQQLSLISSLDFQVYTDAVAIEKDLHHVYEWDEVGDPAGRLFDLQILDVNQHISELDYDFQPSKKPVPVGTANAQDTRTAQHIFYAKAWVAEKGGTFTIRPQTAEVLAWPQGEVMAFSSQRVVTSERFMGNWEEHWNVYWTSKLPEISANRLARAVEEKLQPLAESHTQKQIGKGRARGAIGGIARVRVLGLRGRSQADAHMERVFDLD